MVLENWMVLGFNTKEERDSWLEKQHKIIEKCLNKTFLLGPDVKPLLNIKDTLFCDELLLTLHKTDNVAAILAANIVNYTTDHPEYDSLAARILLCDIYDNAPDTIGTSFEAGYRQPDNSPGHLSKIFIEKWRDLADKYGEDEMNKIVKLGLVHDFNRLTYQGVLLLQKSILRTAIDPNNNEEFLLENPSQMFFRIVIALGYNNLNEIERVFLELVSGQISLATPILYNAGTLGSTLASCYIQTIEAKERVSGFMEALCIANANGGLGFSYEGQDSPGFCQTLHMALKKLVDTKRKRPSVAAIYISPHEKDFLQILENKRAGGGSDLEKTKDLFVGAYIPDIFIERLIEQIKKIQSGSGEDVYWSFFDGSYEQQLRDVWGKEYTELYNKLEKNNCFQKQMPISMVLSEIVKTIAETGVPYIQFKDVINSKNNHSNRGIIKACNLCTEITQFSDKDETAVCVLANINVLSCYDKSTGVFDMDQLAYLTKSTVDILNRVLLTTECPTQKAAYGIQRMKSIGIGIRNLAKVFLQAELPFDCLLAQVLNGDIAECIYFSALKESIELAKGNGPYPYFSVGKNGSSDYANGILQYDYEKMDLEYKEVTPICLLCETNDFAKCKCSSGKKLKVKREDEGDVNWIHWLELKADLTEWGIAHSVVTAQMPTSMSSQHDGGVESFEPLTYLIYKASTFAGESIVINPEMVDCLIYYNAWNEDTVNKIIKNNGMLPKDDEELGQKLPSWVFNVYRTSWEIDPMSIMRMARARGSFIDQGQSLNVYLEKPTANNVVELIIYARKLGLKGFYYTRSRNATSATKIHCERCST